MSEFGDKYAIAVIIGVSYNTLELPKSFIVNLSSLSSVALVCLLKSIYHEARPFFIADIKPYKCALEHGDPSGHSIIVAAVNYTFLKLAIR